MFSLSYKQFIVNTTSLSQNQ